MKQPGKWTRILATLAQATWGLPQFLLGAALCLRHRNCPRERFRTALVTLLPGRGNSVSLGAFVFVRTGGGPEQTRSIRAHEYGHSIQSLLLGPLYLLVIGLPSLIWCDCCEGLRRRKNLPYGTFYPERWADMLGRQYTEQQEEAL